jgi:hypothetical protein
MHFNIEGGGARINPRRMNINIQSQTLTVNAVRLNENAAEVVVWLTSASYVPGYCAPWIEGSSIKHLECPQLSAMKQALCG